VEQGIKPVGSALRRTGITADHLTATGLVVAAATAVAVGSGHLLIGFVLLVLAAIPDLLDGAVAKASGTASPRGAFFDSVADRVTDALLLGGVAWHLAATRGGLAPLLPMAVLGASMLISYERAKAESLGFNARGGLMERAERIIALAAGLAFPFVLIPVLWVTLALTCLTAVQRFVKVWRQASAPRERDRVQVAQRWRAWRESATASAGERTRVRRAVRERPRRSRSWRHSQGARRP
jgi:CDP-diacylglycerol--glycerol-3-phosphate 3-phosphatidyltransferase